jgi:hypothetical protein
LCHLVGLEFLQNIPITIAEKQTDKPGNAIKDLVFRVLFEIVKFQYLAIDMN